MKDLSKHTSEFDENAPLPEPDESDLPPARSARKREEGDEAPKPRTPRQPRKAAVREEEEEDEDDVPEDDEDEDVPRRTPTTGRGRRATATKKTYAEEPSSEEDLDGEGSGSESADELTIDIILDSRKFVQGTTVPLEEYTNSNRARRRVNKQQAKNAEREAKVLPPSSSLSLSQFYH